MIEEGTEETSEQENTELEGETSQGETSTQDDFNAKEEILGLKNQLQSLVSVLSPKNGNQERAAAPSDEDFEAIKSDPKALKAWLAKEATKAKSEISDEFQKQTWDQKAYNEFPSLKANKDFQKAVLNQMNELVTVDKSYTNKSPTLLYRASQIVAARMGGGKQVTTTKTTSSPSSIEPGGQARPTPTKPEENNPWLQMGRMMGIGKGDPKKFEKFKSFVSENYGKYVRPDSPRGRRINRYGED